MGHDRPTGAPLLGWAEKLEMSDPAAHVLLLDTLARYYRSRFDPLGVTIREDQLLSQQVDELLVRLTPAVPTSGRS